MDAVAFATLVFGGKVCGITALAKAKGGILIHTLCLAMSWSFRIRLVGCCKKASQWSYRLSGEISALTSIYVYHKLLGL